MPRPVPTGQNHDCRWRLHHQHDTLPVEVVPSGWLLARGVASRVSRLLCARGRGHVRRESRRPQAGTRGERNPDFTPREPHGATDGEDFGLLLSGGGE